MSDKDCFSVADFCARNSISRAFLYELWEIGKGPARMRIGRRTLISAEAATEWRRVHTEGGAGATGAAGAAMLLAAG